MILKYISKGIILAMLLLSMQSFAQDGDEVEIDRIICKVDNYIILKSELERAYLDFLSRGQFYAEDPKCDILESLIINKVLVAKAEIDSVVVSDIEVEGNLEGRIQALLQQVGGTAEDVKRAFGKDLEEIKDELRDDIKEQLVAQRMQGTITEEISVSPAEVKRFFNNIPTDSLPYYSKEVTLAQIVKIPDVSEKEEQRVYAFLSDLKARIEKGEVSFEDMARKYSEDPGSASRGGCYDYVSRGDFAPEYEAAAFSLEPGEISEPIRTDFGFHIVKLIDRRGNEYASCHILISPRFLPDDYIRAEAYLDSVRTLLMMDSLQFETAAKDISDDKDTAPSGGFLLDPSGVNRISVDRLDPTTFFTIDTMSVGDISPPIRYEMMDGTNAVRIVYYQSEMPPHQANLRDDYQKIQAATLNRKKANILNDWFEKAKEEVFIDLDKEYNSCNIIQ